jgi:hypothetical protein
MKKNTKQKNGETKRRKKHIIIIVAVFLGVIVLLFGIDHWLPYMLLSHYKFSVNPQPGILTSQNIIPEQISFRTSDGIDITGWFISSESEGQNKTVTIVVLHTLGRTREDMLEFCLPFRDKGYNIAFIDLRGHGESGGEFFTYGYHEKSDVQELIDYLKKVVPESSEKIVLLGVSAGGAVCNPYQKGGKHW